MKGKIAAKGLVLFAGIILLRLVAITNVLAEDFTVVVLPLIRKEEE